jgi:hypothetical protein
MVRLNDTSTGVGQLRGFARLANAMSKKLENHVYAFALHRMYHNFVKQYGTKRMSPAQSVGLDSRPWKVSDMVKMIEEQESENERS